MNNEEYLLKSADTAKVSAPEDLKLTYGELLQLVDIIETGIEADKMKRKIFYKETEEKSDARAEANFVLLKNYVDGFLNKDVNKVYTIDQKYMDIYHGILGIQSEVGELTEALLYPLLEGKPLDDTNIQEECGDKFWYIGLVLRAIGKTISETFQKNNTKLDKVRYKNGFTTEAALNRDLEEERKVLENKY